jgi:hypothetical protein
MSLAGLTLGVLAQAGGRQYRKQVFDAMQERFVSGEPNASRGILTTVVALGLLFGAVLLLYRWQRRRRRPSPAQPMSLYRRVLGKLGLSMVDRWWLWRLARFSRTEHPTAMLISSRLYDTAVGRFCASQGLFLSRAGSAVSFRAIRQKLFGAESATV